MEINIIHEINSIMKILFRHTRVFTFLLTLLLLAGVANKAWATDVTYHILTLPIPDPLVPGNYNYHMASAVTGKRLEAVKVVVNGQTQLELPAHFKSPLADNFTYYAVSDVTKSGSAVKLFDETNNSHKAFTYEVKGGATPVAEKKDLSGSKAEYYVVYTYNASNTIAQLNGSVKYNIGVKNKGFFSLNRGRNNRPAAMPKDKVNAEMLASEEFVYINNPGSGIATYWDGKADQKNKKEDIESQFHFIFQFEGVDPYNIIICTAYDKNTTYIEKNDNSNPAEFVYKYYKEGSFFTNGTAKGYIASDEHRHYNYTYDSSLDANPTDLTKGDAGTHTGWDVNTGYYHGQKGVMWNSFALLYNPDKSGYVFMGTRTVDGNGNVPGPTNDGKYYYLKTDNNDFFIAQQTTASVSSNYTIEGIYPIKPVTFKVKTKFYNEGGTVDEKAAHTVSATANISQYTIDNDDIDDKFIPNELRRKYCTFTTTYRNSDGDVITKYSQMKSDGVIFLEYNVSESLPFKAITPAASYDANTWKAATWYELTDDGSTQADGKKLKFNSPYFKNNGNADDYAKTSEYAFIGDPYELLVVYRDATQAPENTTHVPYYVGVGTLNTGTDLTTNTTASAGYKWEMPDDATAGSFLLRNYRDANKGYWRWDTDHVNESRSYATKSGQIVNVTNSESQTITLNITDFAGGDGHYFKITAAGDNPSQIDSSNPVLDDGMGDIHGTSGTATITLKSSGGSAKSFKLSIQEYNLDNVAQGAPCDITINQGTTPYTGNNVEYSTEGATRIKVMELPEFAYTYQVIDMSGAIAIKATVKQTIFSPLNGYDSIPEVIRSPFLADETVTYYSEYSGGGRGNLLPAKVIDEVPKAAADIFISYTLAKLSSKNIKLDASQRFKVKLDEEYIYYDATEKKIRSTLEPSTESSVSDYYSWKLLGQDPYAMLIENVGNHQYVKVNGETWGNDKALDFVESGYASRFIAMMGNYIGVYEVMAATGNTSYYHIGRPSTSGAETKVYSTTTYDHGSNELRFELAGEDAITYHLIDKSNNKLLDVSTYNPRLALPAEYVSPLVSTYYYYKTEAGAKDKTESDRITEITQDEDRNIYVTYDVNDLIGFNNSGRIDDHPYLLRFLQPFEEGYYLEDGNDKLTTMKLKAIYPYCNGDGNLNVYGERMRNEQMDGGSSTRSRWVWFFESANNDPYHVRLHSRNTIEYKSVKYPTYLQTSVVQFKQDPGKNRIVTGGALPGIASETPTEYMVLGTAGQFRLRTTYKINDGTSDVRRDVKTLEQYWKTYNMIKHEMLNISGDAFSTDPTTWVVPENKRADLKTKLLRLKYTADDEYKMVSQINDFTATGVYYFRIGTSTYEYKKITVTTVADKTKEPITSAVYTSEDCSPTTWEGPNYVDGWIWHSYEEYANAVRWNGYNDKSDGEGTKIVEKLEHWYQTFDMGNGSFDVETAVIPPVLILLDRHGWEIMRKPLPDKSTYPYGTEILAALKVYDSPLVKEYKFYSNATKAHDCHKYVLRLDDKKKERDQIKVDGKHFTSKSLADLPPITASGVLSSGVLNDQFVTYTVKDEYEDNYDYNLTLNKETETFTETGESQPYLVLQHGRFYKTPNSSDNSYISKPIYEHTRSGEGNVYDLIADPVNHGGTNADIIDGSGNWIQNNFWRVMPNLDIDEEMGIVWTSETDTTKLEPYTRYHTKEKYKNKTGFDPYNIQLQLINQNNGIADGRFLTTHMTSTSIVNGAMKGDYSGDGGTINITLETRRDATNPAGANLVHSEGYDHSDIKMTNQTFMAVSDANGNMQLMPRFDHTLRVDLQSNNPWETKLMAPKDNGKKASADDNSSMGSQTTFFVPARRYHYHIIDNEGNEAIRYKRGGDFYPAITDHFKSPIAKDFTYYKTAPTYDSGTNTLTVSDEITGSLAAAGLTAVDNDVYVRYSYDEEADKDADQILQGKWFTVKLANKDLQSSGTIVTTTGDSQGTGVLLYAGNTTPTGNENDKPATINASTKKWQWKFLKAPIDPASELHESPDPYAVKLFNRAANYSETMDEPNPMSIPIKVPSANDGANRFVLLSHPDGGYALAVARTDATYTYKFLNGAAMTTPDAGTPHPATTYIENRQQITVTDEDYDTEKDKLPLAIDEEYYFKINNVAYMQVTVTGGPDAPVRTEGVPENPKSYKDEWTSATGNLKKTAVDVSDYNKQRDALKDNGVYYFRITSSSVTYNKVTVISGVKTETLSNGTEWNSGTECFTNNTNALSPGTQLLVNNDVTHEYTYHVITNKKMVEEVNEGNKLAVSDTQTNEEAASHNYAPHLPEDIQTPLLNIEDYEYYGSATKSGGTYTVVDLTKLFTLHGLYDDVVYVRYGAYSMDKTPFKVPNVRNATSETTVAKGEGSQDASLNIEGGLPYNIIWYDDKMMSTNEGDTEIAAATDHALDGDHKYVWYFTDNDPYALKIKHKLTGGYVNGTTTLTDEASAKQFMLLKKDGYDYGILQVTGTTGSDAGKKLTGYGGALTSTNPEDENYEPKKFIIFGLSVHDLIYRLIIARTCTDSEKASPEADQYVDIPCKGETGNTKRIYGTTQRDLSTTYQLGGTINVDTTPYDYCVDAGAVSIGDLLQVPNEFRRPNCSYEFYIDGVWDYYDSSTKTISGANTPLNELHKGEKLNEDSPRLMSDEKLINKVVRVNIVYSFDKKVATNNGMDFVKSTNDKCWYTFETPSGTTPYLAHYTNAWGLQSMEGRATRYTNDYLWTPVGDVYGFKLYNRYMIKNSDGSDKVMTFDGTISEGKNLAVAKPGSTVDTKTYTLGNEVFELLTGDNPNSGYFRVHPVVNNSGTQYYVKRDASDSNYAKLSTTPGDWTFGLDMSLMEPYHERAGYVGGLTPEGKTAYETKVSSGTIMDIQHVVYDDENIIPFTSGYYRLHNQPGVSNISPVRYASGYLHETEKTAGTSSTAIPMHFYSKADVNTTFQGESGLESGFTLTDATRGEIPVPATEYDSSTIFYLDGAVTSNKTISTATMSTQGLYVKGRKIDDAHGDAVMVETENPSSDATTFTLIDIGGATFLVVDKLDPADRNYLNFDQTYEESSVKMIYDLKFMHDSPTDDAKWCLQPVQKTGTAGNGEMPLKITTNDGGDGYYYSTLYLPYDVLLPADAGGKTYNAYICKKWHDTGVNPVPVPAVSTYDEGKFVPAGTPVIIRTNDDSEKVTLTLPNTTASTPLSCVFTGEYLEKKLEASDPERDVYTLGLPMKSHVEKAGNYDTSGDIVAAKPEFADNGVGFYINATPNKEANAMKANWTRNNLYVLHNKIYYRKPASSPSTAPQQKAPEFVPVIFDDEEEQQEMNPDGTMEIVGDGCIYDLMGRKVATREQVEDGSWRQRVATGIYILNGKKFQKK